MLDDLLLEKSFLALKCPPRAIMADICGVIDRVCHGRENAPVNFSLYITLCLLIYM